MPVTLQSILQVRPLEADNLASKGASQPGAFRQAFENAVQQVEQYRTNADEQTRSFLSGENQDLHTVALATQQSELAFEMFQQVRNKVVQAYQEVMRMQL